VREPQYRQELDREIVSRCETRDYESNHQHSFLYRYVFEVCQTGLRMRASRESCDVSGTEEEYAPCLDVRV
jgi:hypothetical protein